MRRRVIKLREVGTDFDYTLAFSEREIIALQNSRPGIIIELPSIKGSAVFTEREVAISYGHRLGEIGSIYVSTIKLRSAIEQGAILDEES
jgi:hypothetical protein